MSILAEVRGAPGVLLWQSLRDVHLWAETPEENRRGLFTSGASVQRLTNLVSTRVDPGLEILLDAMVAMLDRPDETDAGVVGGACFRVGAWAAERGLAKTRIAFLQAAALVDPTDADAALSVGIAAADDRQSARAETWLRRAVAVARRTGNGNAYALAAAHLGDVLRARGDDQTAARAYRTAMDAARRWGIRAARGIAARGIAILSVRGGFHGVAERFWNSAEKALSGDVKRRTNLTFEMADAWIAAGEYRLAQRALQRLRNRRPGQTAVMGIHARRARIAAALGEDAEARKAWDVAWKAIDADLKPDDRHAEALQELVHAAVGLGDERLAHRASRLAMRVDRMRDTPPAESAPRGVGQVAYATGTRGRERGALG